MKTLTKIGFLASKISGGGAERVLQNIINSLDEHVYEIHLVVVNHEIDIQALKSFKDSVIIHRLNFSNVRKSYLKLYFLLRKLNLNYLFTTHFSFYFLLPILKYLLPYDVKCTIRIALTPSEYEYKGLKSKVVVLLNKLALRYSDKIVVQTEYMAREIIKFYHVSPRKTHVITNIVDEKLIKTKSKAFYPVELMQDRYNIVASGALYSVKGFDLLIEGFKSLAAELPNAMLYILGAERYEKGYKDFLILLINKFELENRVFLLGYKDNPYPYYYNADLFVLSSRKEGFPNVVLESLTLGVPVVATDCVDFKGVIENNVNGVVIKKKSHEDITNGILQAYNSLKKPVIFIPNNYNYAQLFEEIR